MAENCKLISDAVEYKIEDENSVTMLDVLKEEEELEEDADAVLGGSDDKNCTFDQGYVKRQALYSCLTCVTAEDTQAGICLACSYVCHEKHELVELYTKRNFRCDCGNRKFAANKCKLEPNKAEVNTANQYNQNFSGTYCSCGRVYPDPEDSGEDEMIQCVICEDWFHGRHLNLIASIENNFSEMTCEGCVKKHEFLSYYRGCTPSCTNEEAAHKTGPNEKKTENVALDTPESSVGLPKKVEETSTIKSEVSPETSEVSSPISSAGSDSKTVKLSSQTECLLKIYQESVTPQLGTLFWKDGWRKLLCRCSNCQLLYEAEKVSFLLDEEDTVEAYEAKGKRRSSQYVQGMEALSSMGRVQQVEALHEYNNLKSQLMDYLKKFADNKKVVREEDIREFFAGLQSQKRQRTEVPYFCR